LHSSLQDHIGRLATVVTILYVYGAVVIIAGSGVLADHYPAIVAYAFTCGGLAGSFFTVLPPFVADLVEGITGQKEHTGKATTLLFSLAGLGFLAGDVSFSMPSGIEVVC